ncbi:FAD-binding protein [Rhodococcus opacus]|uniref:FAD-binding protein n=1 Tax=Rhodococcus opacus TaxID=37919 RepID=UPI0006BB495F|nr:FAD-binding protein [Rhodococcus opacus]MDJ0420252.1 FAD-binding protein [Rhodococcus opacus]MDV7090086.1 FAD-binding protein [Rhodococcus opacus]UNN04560.1 FAD-binding protein [Rhodococcus opacus]WKN52629.1 FAD-binding protein [Rhodococcus opacus]
MTSSTNYDLIVVGSGAAGLAAALTYAEADHDGDPPHRIAVLERSKKEDRGGATRWTGAFLRVNEDHRFDPDYADHLDRVSGGRVDTAYVRKLEREVPETLRFIEERGVELTFNEFPLAHRFDNGVASMTPPGMPKGGGKSIVETLASKLEQFPNVDYLYETEALRLTTAEDGAVNGLIVRGADGRTSPLTGRSVVLACGGFEGNYEVLTRYIGERACDLPLIAPGIANNRGDGLRMALELGADTAGQFDMIHAEPADTRSSAPDAVLYSYTAGIFVNRHGDRFFDEGSDTWDNTFEKIGYEIWKNQDQAAYWIADAKTLAIPGIENGFLSDLAPEQADTLEELAAKLGLSPEAVEKTVAAFNASTTDDEFDQTRFDGKHTIGITPQKSNWAVPIDTPPFIGYPLTAVITFTYGGIRTDLDARVVVPNGTPIPNLYAAGEVTGLYYHEYPPATSVLRSLTFGRIAGAHASKTHASATRET